MKKLLTVVDIISFLSQYTMIYLRHAKAVPPVEGQSDIERALDETGIAEAARAADLRERCGIKPHLIICSPAKRCLQTADAVQQAVVRPELYCEATGMSAYAASDLAFFRASYAKLGNAPNLEYFSFPGADGDGPFRRWTDGDGKTGGALRAIADEIVRLRLRSGAVVMIVAHGNFGSFLMQRIAEGDNSDVVEYMRTHQLLPAHAYILRRGEFEGVLTLNSEDRCFLDFEYREEDGGFESADFLCDLLHERE